MEEDFAAAELCCLLSLPFSVACGDIGYCGVL